MSPPALNTSREAIWIAASELLAEQGVFTKNDLENRLQAHKNDDKIESVPSEHTIYDVLKDFEQINFIEKRTPKSSVHRPDSLAEQTLNLSARATLLSQASYQPYLIEKDNDELSEFLLDQSDAALQSLFHENISPKVIRDLATKLTNK